MKKFKFGLEPVLQYRKYVEKQKQQELAIAIKKSFDCKRKIASFKEKHSECRDTLDEKMAQGLNYNYHYILTGYLTGLNFDIKSSQKESIKLKKRVLEKQKLLATKQIDRKLIDKIKEKRKKLFYEEFIKIEQKEADDMVLLKVARKKNE